MTNQTQTEAMMQVVAEIVKTNPDARIYEVVRTVQALGKIARHLHKRYENACSFQWANTERYEKRTETLEAAAVTLGASIGVTIDLQRDPRGWPLIVKAGPYESRLG